MTRDVVVHPDARVLAESVAARLLTHLVDVQSHRSPVHVVLTGGSVGIASLKAVAAMSPRQRVARVHARSVLPSTWDAASLRSAAFGRATCVESVMRRVAMRPSCASATFSGIS